MGHLFQFYFLRRFSGHWERVREAGREREISIVQIVIETNKLTNTTPSSMKESRSSKGQISSIQPQRKKTSREQVGRVGWPIGAYWRVLGGRRWWWRWRFGLVWFWFAVSGLSGRVGLRRWWYYTTPAFGGRVRWGGYVVRQRVFARGKENKGFSSHHTKLR